MNQFDLSTYDYDLPPHRIAQRPVEPRDEARLMVVDRKTGTIQDRIFKDLPDILNNRDTLVLNETRVIPARLFGIKKDTGARIEVLLLHPEKGGWACLVRPAKRVKPGTELCFGEGLMKARVRDELPFAGGRLLEFYGYDDWYETLDKIGQIPLPPYINRLPDEEDTVRYQTVYAREPGSAAAPTAGLHFTESLLERLQERGVEIVKITLHVGLGTFRPVEVQDIRKHRMHRETYELGREEALTLNRHLQEGRRLIAVGTTSVRTLETTFEPGKGFKAGRGETDLFIYPGYQFKAVQALITNFHLPRSSLLMLVYAFGGIELMRRAYHHAIENGYRFFSYGDAMLIL